MNVTLKQLKVFLSIVRHENMTLAAKALYMTKGAVSQNLAALESQLNVRLFDRVNSKLCLNQSGDKLIALADELLSRAEYIDNAFSSSSVLPRIKIGCTKSIGAFFLPNLLPQFEREMGYLPEIVIDNAYTIEGMLNRFELDIALLESAVTDISLSCQYWMTDEMVVVSSNQHPFALQKVVSYSQLSQSRWILREPNSASRKFFENQLAIKLDNPISVLSLNSFDSILLNVYNQLGLTFISKEILIHPFYVNNLVQLNTEDVFLRKFNIVCHKDKFLSKDILDWIDLIKKSA